MALSGLVFMNPAPAQARASCSVLENLIKDMDILADALEDAGNQPDDRLDRDIRQIVVDARNIVEDENDELAENAINGMIDGWNDGDAALYLRSSDRLAARLEFFLDEDC